MNHSYLRVPIEDAALRVNQASIDTPGAILVTISVGTIDLDLSGDPQEIIDLAARIAAVATDAQEQRRAEREARAALDAAAVAAASTVAEAVAS